MAPAPLSTLRQRTELAHVRTDRPVYLHGTSDGLEAARQWLLARGCDVRGYVDPRPAVDEGTAVALHDLADFPEGARIYIYGAGRDGRFLLERLRNERPDVEILGIIDDRGPAAIAGPSAGEWRALMGVTVAIRTLAASAQERRDDHDLFVVASTNHGPTNLARAAAAGIPRLALLRFGFAPPDLTSFAIDWVLTRSPDAAFILSENARVEVWQTLDRAQVPAVFTAALWSFVAAPLACDEPSLAALTAHAESSLTLLERLGDVPAFAGLLRPSHTAQPPSAAPPPALVPLLRSFFARVATPAWAEIAPDHLRAWGKYIANLPDDPVGPRAARSSRDALRVCPIRTARHLGNYDLAEGLLADAPVDAATTAEAIGVHLDQGRCSEALALLSAAHATAPEDPDIAYLFAGTALFQTRNTGAPVADGLSTLVERLVTDATSACASLSVAPADLPDRLTRFGFGVMRGAIDDSTMKSLQLHYRSMFDALTEAERQALAMGTAVSATQAQLVHEALARSGGFAAIETYLGSPPHFVAEGSFNRHRHGSPPPGLCVYHQDGRIGNRLTREVTCWVPLSACGRHAPSVELIARRFHGFFPLGDGHPKAKRAAALLPNDFVVPGTTVTPLFEPGDVLIFDKFTPHRTQPLAPADLRNGGERFSMDLRWYSDRLL